MCRMALMGAKLFFSFEVLNGGTSVHGAGCAFPALSWIFVIFLLLRINVGGLKKCYFWGGMLMCLVFGGG